MRVISGDTLVRSPKRAGQDGGQAGVSVGRHDDPVPTKHRRADRGTHQGHQLLVSMAVELRAARLAAGLSQVVVGGAAGISGSHLARLERGSVAGASVLLYARLFAVLGMRLSMRPYPEGPPVRDAAHARLLGRFRVELPPEARLRTEVPLRLLGDLRAWDAELVLPGGDCKVEAETVLYDLQATERRIALKMADDQVDVVILLVADTQRNRRVLQEFGPAIRGRFPLDTRAVMERLRSGRLPEASGVVLR